MVKKVDETIVLENLPSGTYESLPLDKLVHVENVRGTAADKQNGLRLADSIRRDGYHQDSLIGVWRHADGTLQIVQGHGRVYGCRNLTPAEQEVANCRMLPCLVYKDITPAQASLLRARDFSDSAEQQALDSWDVYLLIKDIALNYPRLSESGVAAQIGWLMRTGKNVGKPNRSKVQARYRLAKMAGANPGIEAEYEKLWTGCLATDTAGNTTKTNVRVGDILSKLAPAAADDMTGRAVQAVFAEIMQSDAPETPDKPHSLTPKAGRDLATSATSQWAKRLILALTNQPMMTGMEPETVESVVTALHATETDKTPTVAALVDAHSATLAVTAAAEVAEEAARQILAAKDAERDARKKARAASAKVTKTARTRKAKK